MKIGSIVKTEHGLGVIKEKEVFKNCVRYGVDLFKNKKFFNRHGSYPFYFEEKLKEVKVVNFLDIGYEYFIKEMFTIPELIKIQKKLNKQHCLIDLSLQIRFREFYLTYMETHKLSGLVILYPNKY